MPLLKPEHVTAQTALNTEQLLSLPIEEVYERLEASPKGLSSKEEHHRLLTFGHNEFVHKKRRTALANFFWHIRNPLILILLAAAIISAFFGQVVTVAIIISMVLLSVFLDVWQEGKAGKAAEKLEESVTTTVTVLRDGQPREIRLSMVVPGDIVHLSAGDMVPADCRVLTAKDLFVDQAALTGESFPVEKTEAPLVGKDSLINEWTNCLLMGTSVISGTATAVVIHTGNFTEYGKIAKKLVEREIETESELGLRKFGYLIMQVTFLLVLSVFLLNAAFKRPAIESLLFAVALAIGLTPELLPMIISLNLSKAAIAMSKKSVIVKRLNSVQNFGSMDVLCMDKTGTLTEARITLAKHINLEGREDSKVMLYSYLNSFHQTGLKSPFDEAILKHPNVNTKGYEKIDEIPFDFSRKRVSIVVEKNKQRWLLTKGAPEELMKVSSYAEIGGSITRLNTEVRKKIEKRYHELSAEGFRVLGIAYKKVKDKKVYELGEESDMVFLGMITFIDPPKHSARESMKLIEKEGVQIKILTGDNELVTKKICQELDFEVKGVLLGSEIEIMSDDALEKAAERTNIFARVTPAQKDRIINALRANKHVVGFLGDGINDAPPLKAADVGVSVNNAVDIAKESADIILLKKDLTVLRDGLLEGRKTFGNTIKYIIMGTSSNFGNMFSAATASLFLNFLPMLPIQLILNNFLYDMSETTMPTDNVDKEYVDRPRKWDIPFIKRFMLIIGPISSIFDFLTFGVLLFVFSATAPLFQTAWFVESLTTQTLVVFIIRTRKAPWKSRPSKWLLISCLSVVAAAWLIPFSPLAELFGFTPLPTIFLLAVVAMVVVYLVLVELVKRWFYRKYGY